MHKRDSITRSGESPNILSVDGLALDLDSRTLIMNGTVRKLTPKECQLLALFMRHYGQVLTRKFLMKEVWETEYMGDTRTLDVHICWVRKKIEEDPHRPQKLCTIRGVGYRFGM